MSLPSHQRAEALHHLTAAVDRFGLREPLRMALDALSPLDFLNSQLALFVRPFSGGCSWERYVMVLSEEAGWSDLRALLNRDAARKGTGDRG
jgi:hypothetical protein